MHNGGTGNPNFARYQFHDMREAGDSFVVLLFCPFSADDTSSGNPFSAPDGQNGGVSM